MSLRWQFTTIDRGRSQYYNYKYRSNKQSQFLIFIRLTSRWVFTYSFYTKQLCYLIKSGYFPLRHDMIVSILYLLTIIVILLTFFCKIFWHSIYYSICALQVLSVYVSHLSNNGSRTPKPPLTLHWRFLFP